MILFTARPGKIQRKYECEQFALNKKEKQPRASSPIIPHEKLETVGGNFGEIVYQQRVKAASRSSQGTNLNEACRQNKQQRSDFLRKKAEMVPNSERHRRN